MNHDREDEAVERLLEQEEFLGEDDEIETLTFGEEPIDEADWLEQQVPVEGDDEDYPQATE